MIRCLAIDDEPLALRQLESYIAKTDFLEWVASCPSALEARKLLAREPIDAIFTDINMPDLGGMDFVKALADPPLVVFTTAYPQYAVEGFKVNAVDYLMKPFGLDEFLVAAKKVKRQYDLLHAAAAPEAAPVSAPEEDTLFFKMEHRMVRVRIPDIIHVQGMGEYLKIRIAGEKEPAIVLLSMKKLEESLPARRFLRIHKSYLVNLERISQVSKGHVLMEDGASLPVGDLYREALSRYVGSKTLGK